MTENNPPTGPAQPGGGEAAPGQPRPEGRRHEATGRTALVAAGLLIVGVVAAVGIRNSGRDGSEGAVNSAAPIGTRTFENLSQDHVPGDIRYPETPPVGGNHNRVWQNCGFYPGSIVTEMGVHTLEHGAVWITYRPELPAAEITSLQRLAEEQTYILVSAWREGLPSPVVASAWGRQVTLKGADDPKLAEFVGAFRQGPQTPEPGAPCTGGQRAMA